jgi:large subunit ribosomal protein L30
MTNKTLKVTLVRSPIGSNKRQKATVTALGLRRLGQSVNRSNTPVIRGMINQVSHLVNVEEISN